MAQKGKAKQATLSVSMLPVTEKDKIKNNDLRFSVTDHPCFKYRIFCSCERQWLHLFQAEKHTMPYGKACNHKGPLKFEKYFDTCTVLSDVLAHLSLSKIYYSDNTDLLYLREMKALRDLDNFQNVRQWADVSRFKSRSPSDKNSDISIIS